MWNAWASDGTQVGRGFDSENTFFYMQPYPWVTCKRRPVSRQSVSFPSEDQREPASEQEILNTSPSKVEATSFSSSGIKSRPTCRCSLPSDAPPWKLRCFSGQREPSVERGLHKTLAPWFPACPLAIFESCLRKGSIGIASGRDLTELGSAHQRAVSNE